MNKTILITGGLGYIGSHAVVAFEEAGYKTVIVDNLVNACLSTYRGIGKILGYKPDFYEIDIQDSKGLEKIFEKYNFDGVLHFAGLKAVGESCEKPGLYYDNNLVGNIKLFNCMEKYGVKNIIFSSSATVYNYDNEIPYIETQEVGKTTNPYGNIKYLTEQILKDYSKFAGFNVMNLRYFNPIGAHPSGIIGEKPDGIPNNLLPFILKVSVGELKELKVFGGDYDTIDGTGVRDYIDVNDLIKGHLKGYRFLENNISLNSNSSKNSRKGFFENVNLGVGKGVSVLEIISTFEKVTGVKIPYKIVERRAGDLGEFYCSSQKAKQNLNWETETSLEESLKNSWKFYNV